MTFLSKQVSLALLILFSSIMLHGAADEDNKIPTLALLCMQQIARSNIPFEGFEGNEVLVNAIQQEAQKIYDTRVESIGNLNFSNHTPEVSPEHSARLAEIAAAVADEAPADLAALIRNPHLPEVFQIFQDMYQKDEEAKRKKIEENKKLIEMLYAIDPRTEGLERIKKNIQKCCATALVDRERFEENCKKCCRLSIALSCLGCCAVCFSSEYCVFLNDPESCEDCCYLICGGVLISVCAVHTIVDTYMTPILTKLYDSGLASRLINRMSCNAIWHPYLRPEEALPHPMIMEDIDAMPHEKSE